MAERQTLAGLDRDELVALLKRLDAPAYRADQILEWFYRHRTADFARMSILPEALRRALPKSLRLYTTRIAESHADEDGTVKLVLRLFDDHSIETVMIPERGRRTACVSTQVGCPVHCAFCASGAAGFERNLEVAEIVEQVLHATAQLPESESLTHLVFMGIGEPLLNLDNLMKAIGILNAPWGLNIGARRMTVSTVGVRGTIDRFRELGLQVNLAVSLHAADDAVRRQLIPYGNLMTVDGLTAAAEDYYLETGRETTFEVVLIDGVNDSIEMAELLVQKVKRCHGCVNLIRYNAVAGAPYRPPTEVAFRRFRQALRDAGIKVTARRRRGAGVGGACGQLRLDALGKDAHG